VGHVDVDIYSFTHYPPYLVGYHGWWPDALLTFQQTCTVNSGDRAAFWIDVATLTSTVPGDYSGTINITASDTEPRVLQLNVHVWDFELPFRNTMETAFSSQTLEAQRIYGGQWSSAMRYKMYDVLLAHRVGPVELYRTSSPMPFDRIQYCANGGGNAFSLGKIPNIEPADLDGLVSQLKSAGLFEMSFVYGYDEVIPYPEMATKFNAIHTRHPGLRTVTTALDYSFGTSPSTSYLRDAVDIWVPLITWFDADEAVVLRSEGKDMWWYNCVVPTYPYPNWFVEYPAIEARLLMGAMAYKYQTGGHLYWAVAQWINNNAPISSGPYTNWNPRSGGENGDGSIILPGPSGPIPTIRLANIRDGLEDFEYLNILKNVVTQVEQLPPTPQTQSFIASANTLLAVPGTIVDSRTSFTRQPTDLLNFRQQVADAIAQGNNILNPPPSVDGDLNNDQQADTDDCLIIQNAMGTTNGDSGFVPEADYNLDDAITCDDGIIWLAHYRSFVGDPTAADPCDLLPDSDGDTVVDCVDQCPDTPSGTPVDETGCMPPPPGDFDGDFDVDMEDFGHFQACLTGPAVPVTDPNCPDAKLDGDSDVDQDDYAIFQDCMTGTNVIGDPHCAD
ncbi:MAG: DUF4091 domain-containing protein, partial [Planctomycetota bacterium]